MKVCLSTFLFIFYLPSLLWSQRCATVDFLSDQSRQNNVHFRDATIEIQVVFHVVFLNEDENVSAAELYSQLEILNDHFHRRNAKLDIHIPEEFRSVAASPNINFCLAKKDPSGQNTTGVIRVKTNVENTGCRKNSKTFFAMKTSLGGSDLWDPKRYLNIFVAQRKDCGFAQAVFPEQATDEMDGIIIDPKYFGFKTDNRPFHLGMTLVHEMGHYLGLKHLATGNNCNSDDGINDTPSQVGNYFGCPSYPQFSCNTSNQFMNYMSLVDDACMKMFTHGQVERMREVISNQRAGISFPCDTMESVNTDYFLYGNSQQWVIQQRENKEFDGELELYNSLGQKIHFRKVQGESRYIINKTDKILTPGNYFVLIKTKQSNQSFFFFISN
ncbi:MAG TPA: zinc-dependent metalloprotease [Saprospiraceae bacterium]|nr:zinc-dependent metalloprotease [Saprospiraceae bacterium]